jgi:hypothetical protein
MTAPVENPVGQVVGDLMQQGIEPTEMQGLSARELASIRDSLTSEKVATSTQTIEPAFFVPFTNTREKGTQSAPSTLPMSTQTWGSTSTFGTQTTAPDVVVGGTALKQIYQNSPPFKLKHHRAGFRHFRTQQQFLVWSLQQHHAKHFHRQRLRRSRIYHQDHSQR